MKISYYFQGFSDTIMLGHLRRRLSVIWGNSKNSVHYHLRPRHGTCGIMLIQVSCHGEAFVRKMTTLPRATGSLGMILSTLACFPIPRSCLMSHDPQLPTSPLIKNFSLLETCRLSMLLSFCQFEAYWSHLGRANTH